MTNWIDFLNQRRTAFVGAATAEPSSGQSESSASSAPATTLLSQSTDGADIEMGRVLAAVTQNGLALRFASDDLKNNEEVVLAAVRQNGYALEFVSNALRNNKEVFLAAVRQDGYALRFASDDLKNNEEVVLAAVRQNGYVLRFASDDLKNNKEVVLAAVTQQSLAMQRANLLLNLYAVGESRQYSLTDFRHRPDVAKSLRKAEKQRDRTACCMLHFVERRDMEQRDVAITLVIARMLGLSERSLPADMTIAKRGK